MRAELLGFRHQLIAAPPVVFKRDTIIYTVPMDTAPPIPLLSSRRGRHAGGRESQGQGHRQQSMELSRLQNSFSQLLPRALVLFWALVPLARICCAGEHPTAQRRHCSPPSATFGSVHQILDPSTGSSMVPSVQPGTGFPCASPSG